jgi:AraC family transcriptional regulator
LAKIAVALESALAEKARTGARGTTTSRVLAEGEGWRVGDVVCTSGPPDRPFEESHLLYSIAIVAAGSFQYRSEARRELMTPGSLLLGAPGQSFECAHEHGTGDRCLSFWYAADHFDRLAREMGARATRRDFRALRVPPLRALSPLIARACAGLGDGGGTPWEELSLRLAALTVRTVAGLPAGAGQAPPGALARVTRIVRRIERDQDDGALSLSALAREAGLSPYHFLRTFRRVAGVTPHQYVLRTRLREAALRLAWEGDQVLDVALDSGFGDLSNFNRTFRAEFGMTPRAYRRITSGPLPR